MSGGSYDYLYSKGLDEIVDSFYYQKAIDKLSTLEYAQNVVSEMKEIQSQAKDLKARLENLSGALRALEWWESCDSSEESLKEACEKFNEKINSVYLDARGRKWVVDPNGTHVWWSEKPGMTDDEELVFSPWERSDRISCAHGEQSGPGVFRFYRLIG